MFTIDQHFDIGGGDHVKKNKNRRQNIRKAKREGPV